MTLVHCFHLPHITTFNGLHCIVSLETNYHSYMPAPCVILWMDFHKKSLCSVSLTTALQLHYLYMLFWVINTVTWMCALLCTYKHTTPSKIWDFQQSISILLTYFYLYDVLEFCKCIVILTTQWFIVCTCILYLNDCHSDMYLGMVCIFCNVFLYYPMTSSISSWYQTLYGFDERIINECKNNSACCFVWVSNVLCHTEGEHKLGVFENRVLRKIFGPKIDNRGVQKIT
jgi:hypothetical protein